MSPALFFAALCLSVVALTIIYAIVRLYIDEEPLPDPDPVTERLSSKYWRAGKAESGWRP